ncbi:hypothetical protein EON79_07805 [bacterium]|nr:MAG: hypothetical protein EON79_07805 [bacterium]
MTGEILVKSGLAAIMAGLAAATPKPVEVKLLNQASGFDSNMSVASVKLARSSESWMKIWKEHAIPEVDVRNGASAAVRPAPALPFDKVMVLAVFDGIANPRRWVLMSSKLDAKKETVTLRIRPENLNPSGLNVNLTPYTFLFFNRTNAHVVIEAPDRDGFVPIAEFPKIEPPKDPSVPPPTGE